MARLLPLLLILLACGEPATDVSLRISASTERVGDVNRVSAVIEATDAVSAEPVSVPLTVHLAAGTDDQVEATPEEVSPGSYEATFETPLGGPAAVVAELDARDTVEVLDLELPSGPLSSLELLVGDPALPGEPLEVFVVALDELGNPVVSTGTELEGRAELPYVREDTACGEARLRFTSDELGRFPVEVEHLPSGTTSSADLLFLPAAVRRPVGGPITVAEGETGTVEFPVDVFVPDDWPTTRLTVGVTLDAGFVDIAAFEGALVDDDGGCVSVEGSKRATCRSVTITPGTA